VAEGASLESLYTGNCIEGSNPSVSAKRKKLINLMGFFYLHECLRILRCDWSQIYSHYRHSNMVISSRNGLMNKSETVSLST
jgi:hypothetical protein